MIVADVSGGGSAMTPAPRESGAVLYRADGEIDAIDEYSRRLVAALRGVGLDARYVSDGPAAAVKPGAEPSWVLLQYNPFAYGRGGFAPSLLRDVVRLRRRARTPLAVMVHEAWLDMVDVKSSALGLWQRGQLRALLRVADGVMTSTEALAREIGGDAVHVPIASNITPVQTSSDAARHQLGLDGKLAVALFGRANPGRALDYAEAAIAALVEAHGASRLAVLNLGADAPTVRVPAGVDVYNPGPLPPSDVSVRLWASDLVLLPFADGVSTRRGTLMAALAHGRPVIGLHGRNTDTVLAEAQGALALTPAGDQAAFARSAVELTGDRERLQAMGDAGRSLYASRFDWPVIAPIVASVLRRISRSRRRIVFVAHDVGGPGGMERQAEQLVRRLLEDGRPVTVIARTCAISARAGLRFVRVPTPRRPFSVGYPTFFAIASLRTARQRNALVHTMGAIVANRADVATVQYCHRAAATQVVGSRASRPTRLYHINSVFCGILSLAGEAWCYRPGRARLLVAASGGVAAELRGHFPAMAGCVRTVPNGVDADVFRPDPDARRQVRGEIGVDQQAALALFVGGDWERKGLAHAVDALELAPGWQLAVAGPGDPTDHQARALAAGTLDRVHFLGRVPDVPRLYAAADAFVLPTAYEAFPLVTLEAAASGLPLLVTPVNGVRDLLEDRHNGWFISRDARDIAQRLNDLRSDSGRARDMAESARVAASGFSWEAMAGAYMSLYSELLASPDSAPA